MCRQDGPVLGHSHPIPFDLGRTFCYRKNFTEKYLNNQTRKRSSVPYVGLLSIVRVDFRGHIGLIFSQSFLFFRILPGFTVGIDS